jgi:hypothetical protein
MQWFCYYIILRGSERHHTADFIYILQHEIKSLSNATSTTQLINPTPLPVPIQNTQRQFIYNSSITSKMYKSLNSSIYQN